MDDETIMLQAQEGDLDQLTVLFERYGGMLYYYFMQRSQSHTLSEDLTQEVFLRVLKYRKSFKPDGIFKAWLFGIARNVQNRHWALKSTKFESLSEDLGKEAQNEQSDEANHPDSLANRNQEIALLYEALDRLSEDKRQLVILRRLQGLNYKEIADILGCEARSLKIRVHRAIGELSKHLNSIMKERPYEMRRL